ncbi:hypothetical protein SADUNF_Sadunf02G0043100 [Salix dunnii]|uniref:Uncharacterized protein n=1 Tax=Salix dunnii TaxID=1413687 RepID=A0A835N613_9ROSI|nr:hypothetical protein SADUNF_Sadunf02G0043100 [Salix dunnii]
MGLDSDRSPFPRFQVSVFGGLELVPFVAGCRLPVDKKLANNKVGPTFFCVYRIHQCPGRKNNKGGGALLGKQDHEKRFDSSLRLHAERDAEHTLAL